MGDAADGPSPVRTAFRGTSAKYTNDRCEVPRLEANQNIVRGSRAHKGSRLNEEETEHLLKTLPPRVP